MTHSDPTPQSGDPADINSELWSMLDTEAAEDIESGELDLESRSREDDMINRLIDNDFPLLSQALEIRTQLGVESGLTELYDHLVNRTSDFRDKIASTPEAGEALTHNYQLAFLQSRLIIAVQQLAAAKGAQDSVLVQVKEFEDAGDKEQADRWREFAYETRKEAEAQALTNESLGEAAAVRILSAIAPEFEGESLLPLTSKSQEYLMMYQLKEEMQGDDRGEVKTYTSAAQELLKSELTDGQRQHPDFEDFSFSLCIAAARTVLEPKHTVGFDSLQLGTYRSIISFHVAEAIKYAPRLGVEPAKVRTIFENILSRIS